jgi:hypothetical protein
MIYSCVCLPLGQKFAGFSRYIFDAIFHRLLMFLLGSGYEEEKLGLRLFREHIFGLHSSGSTFGAFFPLLFPVPFLLFNPRRLLTLAQACPAQLDPGVPLSMLRFAAMSAWSALMFSYLPPPLFYRGAT